MIMALCNLKILRSSNSPASASQVAGITGAYHHTWQIFAFLVEMRFHHVGQTSLVLLTSGDPPTSASQNAGITGVSLYTQPTLLYIHILTWARILQILENLLHLEFCDQFSGAEFMNSIL